VKQRCPAFESGKVSSFEVSSSFKKQTTNSFCVNQLQCVSQVYPPFCRRLLIKQKTRLGVFPRSYSGFYLPIPSCGSGFKIGHTVGRDQKSPKSLPTLTPIFCLRPPKSLANNHTPILCLYHDLLCQVVDQK
jgi:hypothetical protein